jgi:hypothetical protein
MLPVKFGDEKSTQYRCHTVLDRLKTAVKTNCKPSMENPETQTHRKITPQFAALPDVVQPVK